MRSTTRKYGLFSWALSTILILLTIGALPGCTNPDHGQQVSAAEADAVTQQAQEILVFVEGDVFMPQLSGLWGWPIL